MLSYTIGCEIWPRAVIMLLCWRGCFDDISHLEAVIIRFGQRTDETVGPYPDHEASSREIPGLIGFVKIGFVRAISPCDFKEAES
jgi:hypothetical protein